MDWRELAGAPLPWGNRDVTQAVILTRLLAFRNFAGLPFVASAPPNLCAAAADRALSLLSRAAAPAPVRLVDCPARSIRLLREREILPGRAVAFPGKKAFKHFSCAVDGSTWTLINEVEHLTFGRLLPGCPTPETAGFPGPPPAADGEAWASLPQYGYLASDPGRIGPAVAVEQIVHLPGLALARQLPAARNYLASLGIAFQPATPATVSVPGPADTGLFRLTSRGALGRTPMETYAAHLAALAPVLRRELSARTAVRDGHPKRLKSRVELSLKRLSESRSLSHTDMLADLSMLRLGAAAGLLPPEFEALAEYLRVTVASGHLAVSSGKDMSQEEEDFSRANVVRLSLEKYRVAGI